MYYVPYFLEYIEARASISFNGIYAPASKRDRPKIGASLY